MSTDATRTTRRTFLRGAGAGALAYTVGGATVLLTPREARARAVPLQVLTEAQATTLEAFAGVLVEGAADAGVVHFVDQQLAQDPNDALLTARYFNVEPPFAAFYAAGLAALDGAAQAEHGKPFGELPAGAAQALAGGLLGGNPPGWQGPPAPVVYLVMRSDAVDVVYGTPRGFEDLGIPYMPHILPPRNW